jgi:hypothetical protein
MRCKELIDWKGFFPVNEVQTNWEESLPIDEVKIPH